MKRTLHPYATAGLAAAIASAGLIAITPVAPPRVDSPEVAVQLTTGADDYADIANAASGVVLIAGDMFYALGWNLEHILGGAWDALTALTEFKLADAVHDVAISLANIVLIPENVLLGAVGYLTGDWALPNFDFLGEGAPLDPDMFAGVWSGLQDVVTHIGDSVDELFQGHLGVALEYFLRSINDVVIQIPEQIVVGSTAFIWQDLLGLP